MGHFATAMADGCGAGVRLPSMMIGQELEKRKSQQQMTIMGGEWLRML
jgi:chorismate synthase